MSLVIQPVQVSAFRFPLYLSFFISVPLSLLKIERSLPCTEVKVISLFPLSLSSSLSSSILSSLLPVFLNIAFFPLVHVSRSIFRHS